MFEFFERLGDLFSNGDGSHYDTSGHESVVDGFDGSTLDLSQYTPDDIEDAVRNALGTGDGLHDTSHGYDISFGAAPDVDARNLAKSTLITKPTPIIFTQQIYVQTTCGEDWILIRETRCIMPSTMLAIMDESATLYTKT